MFARRTVLSAMILFAGCDSSAPTSTSPVPAGPETATTVDAPASNSNSSGMQTVEGDGFSVQVPADWTVFRAPTSVVVSTPLDISKQAPPVQLSLAIIPAPPPLVPAEMAATMIDTDKLSPKVVESESHVTVGGKEGTRLETTHTNRVNETSDETSKTRSLYYYVPLDAGILKVEASSIDEFVAPAIPQFDAVVTSLTFK